MGSKVYGSTFIIETGCKNFGRNEGTKATAPVLPSIFTEIE